MNNSQGRQEMRTKLTKKDICIHSISGRDAYAIYDKNGYPENTLNKERKIGEITGPEFTEFETNYLRENLNTYVNNDELLKLCALEKLNEH